MVNKVILIGNVGADPEIRALETGVKMARIRIATTESIYNSSTGERREHTEWHTVVLWRGQADFVEKYIRRGSQVYVEGKIRSLEWTDEARGTKRSSIEILADEIKSLGGRRSDDTSARVAPSDTEETTATAKPSTAKDADDLPF